VPRAIIALVVGLAPWLGASSCDGPTSGSQARGHLPAARAAEPAEARDREDPASIPFDYVIRTTPFPEGGPDEESSSMEGGDRDPSQPLPLVVALHGRGSTPASFARTFDGMTVPARILLVEAPIDEGDGRAWFTFRGKSRSEIAEDMRTLAARVVRTTDRAAETHRTVGKPAVMGFSQGAMLVYILALEHGDRFSAAVPVSGALFESFVPPPDRPLDDVPPITVLHGEADPVIPARFGLRRVDTLATRGAPVKIETFPEVPHWIMKGMKTALYRTLGEAIGGAREGTGG